MQPSGRAFEGVRTPRSVLQIKMKTSGRQSNTVRTLGQSLFNMELDFKSRHCLGSLYSRSNDVATRPDDVQYFRILQSSVRMQNEFQRRLSGRSVKPSRHEPDKDRITLFLKGYRRKQFGRS
jgi:hypothetical protein